MSTILPHPQLIPCNRQGEEEECGDLVGSAHQISTLLQLFV